MKHVYGHTGNLVNECADHAAALGAFGLVSSHNLATRWARHNFDTSACLGSCNNIGEVLENYVTFSLKLCPYLTAGVSAVFFIGPAVIPTHALHRVWFALCPFSSRSLLQCLIVSLVSYGKPYLVCI